MLDWLKWKAAEKQERNIRETLAKLIQVSNEAAATLGRLGDAFPQQREAIRKLQNELLMDLIGPTPLDEIKQRILDPALRAPGTTDGARMAVDHVCDSRNQGAAWVESV